MPRGTKGLSIIAYLMVAILATCEALNHGPCAHIKNGRYTDGTYGYTLSCQNTTEEIIHNEDGDFFATGIFIKRTGAFWVYKLEPQDLYSCFVDMIVDKKAIIIKGYQTDLRPFDYDPDVCQICTDEFHPVTFIKTLPAPENYLCCDACAGNMSESCCTANCNQRINSCSFWGGAAYEQTLSCHCDEKCVMEDNCCQDYELLCHEVEDERNLPHQPFPCNRPAFCPDTGNPIDNVCTGCEYKSLSFDEDCCSDCKLYDD